MTIAATPAPEPSATPSPAARRKDGGATILPGLCSVTFRSLSVPEIVTLAVESGLNAIEWGGDLHVPPGDLENAALAGRRSAEAGLRTPSYGSYFRVTPESRPAEFRPVLETARALGAKTIRVWADGRPSREMDADYFRRLAEAARVLCEEAAQADCELGFEYHLDTATDTNATAAGLLRAIAHSAARLYWQPRQGNSVEERIAGLREILPFLAHLHVFQWVGERNERRPLAEGAGDWRRYLVCAAEAGGERCAYLEFVPGDAVEVCAREAAVLREMLSGL